MYLTSIKIKTRRKAAPMHNEQHHNVLLFVRYSTKEGIATTTALHAMMPASPATYSAYHSAAAAAAAASCAISIFIFAINDSKSSSSSSPSSSCPSSSSCCSCPPSCPPSSSASCNSPPRRPSLQTPPPPPPPPPAAAAAASASSSSQRCKIASRAVFLRSSAAYVARRCETENGRHFLEFSQKSSRACRGGFTYQVKARSKTPRQVPHLQLLRA
jgi:predicted component of type VI protein secretion system